MTILLTPVSQIPFWRTDSECRTTTITRVITSQYTTRLTPLKSTLEFETVTFGSQIETHGTRCSIYRLL